MEATHVEKRNERGHTAERAQTQGGPGANLGARGRGAPDGMGWAGAGGWGGVLACHSLGCRTRPGRRSAAALRQPRRPRPQRAVIRRPRQLRRGRGPWHVGRCDLLARVARGRQVRDEWNQTLLEKASNGGVGLAVQLKWTTHTRTEPEVPSKHGRGMLQTGVYSTTTSETQRRSGRSQ